MPPRIPPVDLPEGIAREYYGEIRRFLEVERRTAWQAWIREIRPLMHRYRREVAAVAANRSGARDLRVNDDTLSDISRILRRLRLEAERRLSSPIFEQFITKFVRRVAQVSASNWRKQVERVIGIDPTRDDTWLAGVLQSAVQENVSWIKSIATEYHDQVQAIVIQGARRGQSLTEMATSIADAGDVGIRRARFIARDQLGSLYGDLTKKRHEAAGMKRFRRRTSRDERVRDSHQKLEGKIFTWAEGATNERGQQIWPGTDYNCRCVAEPLEEELLEVE